jgi:hypothetical protein
LAPSCNSGLPNGIWHFENHANKLSLRWDHRPSLHGLHSVPSFFFGR